MSSSDGAAVRRADRRGLNHEAADRIREAIFDGSFAPGDALREVELAAALEVSRGSVRGGLAILEGEGLVHSGWHRRTRVLEPTVTEANELYAVRAALDRLAAVTAAGNRTAEDLADLDSRVDAMAEGLEAGDPGHVLLARDMGFHDAIYDIAGNGRLRSTWRGLRSQVRLFQLVRIRLGGQQYRRILVDEHRQLVTLLRERDTRQLAAMAEEHVEAARAELVRMLESPGEPAQE